MVELLNAAKLFDYEAFISGIEKQLIQELVLTVGDLWLRVGSRTIRVAWTSGTRASRSCMRSRLDPRGSNRALWPW